MIHYSRPYPTAEVIYLSYKIKQKQEIITSEERDMFYSMMFRKED